MRALLVEGAESPIGPSADSDYFSALRDRLTATD